MPKIPSLIRPSWQAPFWQTNDSHKVRLYQGDVCEVLGGLLAQSVQCVVTSPPYWGLRDYGTDKSLEIGSEKTPEDYVEKMVEVFREVWRVLRDDGTLWLNMGDSYGSGGNLGGMSWRVALALQADGWVLRQDIIWAKPSPMPESVRNRCTKSHEYLFLLTKRGSGYFYDAEAVKETSIDKESFSGRTKRSQQAFSIEDPEKSRTRGFEKLDGQKYPTRNKRSVWWIASEPYPGAHFATFPRKLVEPCIRAGTSEKGACIHCGAPWRRIIESRQLKRDRPHDYVKRTGAIGTGNVCANSVAGVDVKTIGWEATCQCFEENALTRPCVVLDPFVGSGTTCCVAIAEGRDSIGIDLSTKYLRVNAIPRIEGTVLSRPALADLVRGKVEPVDVGENCCE